MGESKKTKRNTRNGLWILRWLRKRVFLCGLWKSPFSRVCRWWLYVQWMSRKRGLCIMPRIDTCTECNEPLDSPKTCTFCYPRWERNRRHEARRATGECPCPVNWHSGCSALWGFEETYRPGYCFFTSSYSSVDSFISAVGEECFNRYYSADEWLAEETANEIGETSPGEIYVRSLWWIAK